MLASAGTSGDGSDVVRALAVLSGRQASRAKKGREQEMVMRADTMIVAGGLARIDGVLVPSRAGSGIA